MSEEENPYAPPRAEVADAEAPTASKPSVVARLLWSAGVCFAIFLVLVMLVLPMSEWPLAALGSAIFAALSGVIAMCIPVKSKAGFIIPSIVVSLVIAYVIGSQEPDTTAQPYPAVERE